MKTPSYRAAIRWMLDNDDTEFLEDAEPIPSVSVCLVADLFEVSTDKVVADLKKARARSPFVPALNTPAEGYRSTYGEDTRRGELSDDLGESPDY